MDAIFKKRNTLPSDARAGLIRPSREEAESAVRTLIAFAGDDPEREGLIDTPKRVVAAYEELYSGYRESAEDVLDRTFSETGGYDDLVLVRDIPFHSHCEHHMMPFFGTAHIAYQPIERVVGLSKLARLIDVFSLRLQTQEHLNSQIAAVDREGAQAAGRRSDAAGRAYLHVLARCCQGRRANGDDAVSRNFPR